MFLRVIPVEAAMNRFVSSKSGQNMVLILLLASEQEFRETGRGDTAMTVSEAASFLNISRQGVLKMVKSDRLIPAAWWEKKLLFRESDVKRIKEERDQDVFAAQGI